MVPSVAATLSAEQIRQANTRYHDLAAEDYDFKWGIDFGAIGRRQVVAKLHKGLGHAPGRYAHTLEIGAGTGYFTLNMLGAGLIERATCSDISPGMLETLQANASRLGLEVQTERVDAERLPFADGSFDLVFGHAVLHHIPHLARAFGEFARVLAPGGTLLFAGEPSRYGDLLAGAPKRAATVAAPLWRRALRARAAAPAAHAGSGAELERVVDVHAFAPSELRAAARGAGFGEVRVSGEELLANWFGWTNRTLEATADPDTVPRAWRHYAYRGYLLLQALDRRLLESRLPPAVFYNLMIAARKAPAAASDAPARGGAAAKRRAKAAGGRPAARPAAQTPPAGGTPAAGRASRR
jgi:ubiquinone/menaquinone biosynthesis C-methylase UbiE